MLVRTKHAQVRDLPRSAFLDFLRGASTAKGEMTEEVELFAPTPILLAEGQDGAVGWTFSTFAVDRYQERVDPEGWELGHYLANPVVQWAHLYEVPAIGRAEQVRSDAEGLHGNVVFNAKEWDPFGWAVGERVRNKVLRAGSVGFLVLEIELPSKRKAEDDEVLIFRRQELLEFSICNVPANPFALAKDSRYGAARGGDFWSGLIKEERYG
jgi:HK97 family phage prohead protease